MHEVAIIQSAVDMAIDQARLAGATRVHLLRLRIGTLSGVVREALEFACEAVTQGTIVEGARLEIDVIPAACWCGSCHAEFECDDFSSECPRCRTWSSELRRGREMELSSVEIS